MMKQYKEIKARYPDVVLFYRMGDFYEMFFEDAVLTSQVLGLTLTKRNHGRETGDVPLAGFPHHQLENYLSKMTRAGYRVAVCDQLEDPKLAKGVVKRDVTEVVSAGTTFSGSMLDERRNNYLAAVWMDENQCGLAYADVTAQEFFTGVLPARELQSRLLSLEPAEVLCTQEDVESVRAILATLKQCTVTSAPRWQFDENSAERTLTGHMQVANLKGFGLTQMQPAIRAAGALLFYVKFLHMDSNVLLPDLRVFADDAELSLDPGTKRNLELVESLTGNREATLLHVMDRTRTSAGGRLLRRWLLAPLRDVNQINRRLDAISFFVADSVLLANLSELLKSSHDLQRLLSRLSTRRASPRDAVAIRKTLDLLPKIEKLFHLKSSESVADQLAALKQPRDLVELISAILVEDPPLAVGDGNSIREGYSPDLDELRHIGSRARTWMQEHQESE
ncbi:DNA mismatch repair protein MutS, partial [bacterium]|nr:DNA mismatch repair protein MutS [bacterium]